MKQSILIPLICVLPLLVTLIRRRAGLFAVLLLIIAPVAPAGPRDFDGEIIQAASARAIAWIENHRATPEDGGLPDMIDEGVSFRVFRELSRTASQRERFAHLFRSQMAALNQHVEFERWVSRPQKSLFDYYHLVLAAYLAEGAGQPNPRAAVISEQARQALTTVASANPTVRLTTALFLTRFDEQAGIDIESLLADSLIERISHERHFITLPGNNATPSQLHAATWLLYALIHEIVALTDFGHLPVTPWLAVRHDAVVRILLDAVTWAGAQQNRDLVAELIVTLYFLKEPLHAQVQAALDELVASQLPDGSWGESITSMRPNKVRHTVLTCAAALLVYLDWRLDAQS